MSISQDSIPRSGASLSASVVAAGITVADDKFVITGSADTSKTIKFEADGMTANDDLTINSGAQTDDRTVTLPVLNGAANFVMREAALTDNAVVRADGTTGLIQNSAVIVDDSNNVTGVVALTIGGALAGVTTIANSGIQTNTNATASTSVATGALTLDGGLGMDGALWVGGLANIAGVATLADSTDASAIGTAGTVVVGGLSVAKKMYIGDNIVMAASKTITNPGGIIFSNETLDDYDKGTWTPVITGDGGAGTPTHTAQVGTYIKTGGICTATCRVTISAKTGITGNVQVSGLPFSVAFGSGGDGATGSMGYQSGLTYPASTYQMVVYAQHGTTTITFWCLGTTGTPSRIDVANLAAATDIMLSISYPTET